MPKIYTKKGDSGETRLLDGTKVDKSGCQSTAVGDLDELNCNIGLSICYLDQLPQGNFDLLSEKEHLFLIQNYLFKIGSIVANPRLKDSTERIFDIDCVYTKEMERRIDKMTNMLPKLTNFIIPGRSTAACQIHITRAICRRAERQLKGLINETDNQFIQINCSAFMNRLSDYLFTLARYVDIHVSFNKEILIDTSL